MPRSWRTVSGSLVRTAWMVRSPVSSKMRLTYDRDLYGLSFLPYLSRSWAAAAMRWACHSWIRWWRVARNARRWAFWSRASGVWGHSRVANSSFVVQMSPTSISSARSSGAPVWVVSHSMPHGMAVVSAGASGRRKMRCRALLYLCQAPCSSSAGNRSVSGRASSGRVAAGGGRAGGREVPVGCLVDAHHGWVPVAHVDAGGVGAGLEGVMGGCAGQSCGEVGPAKSVHGVSDGHVGGCGWAGAVVVGGGGI